MEDDWIGKAVSIECDEKLGIFQGIIKSISEKQITIVRAFRNGVPLRKQDAEVTLRSADILNISLISAYNSQSTVTPSAINNPTPIKTPNFANAGNGAAAMAAAAAAGEAVIATTPSTNGAPYKWDDSATTPNSALSNRISNMKGRYVNGTRSTPTSSRASSSVQQLQFAQNNCQTPSQLRSNSVAEFFGNLIPAKVETRLGAAFPASSSTSTSTTTSCNAESYSSNASGSSKPIDIVNSRGSYYGQNNVSGYSTNGNGNGNSNGAYAKARNGGNANGNSNNGGKKQQRKQKINRENSMKQNQTFGTSVDDPLIHEDFDFEGNLALFDKQAIWQVIETEQNPNAAPQSIPMRKQKYRHDENILVGEPLQLRQIETTFESAADFVTDEGLVIPTIPTFVRSKIELTAEKEGLSLQRQADILARGATDLAILLLGGARRLTPNNCHQWPKIVIICEKSNSFRASNIGAAAGRQIASHGLKVLLYLEENEGIEKKSSEISLFKATGNTVVYSVNALPTPDLVILSTNTADLAVNPTNKFDLSAPVKKWLSENRASILAIDPPPSGIKDVSIKYAILPILPLNGISSNSCGKLYLCNLGIPDKFYRDAGIKYKSPFGHKFVIPIHSKD